jgi:DnaJ-class molecular chaperone
MVFQDYYKVLGIDRIATLAEVKKILSKTRIKIPS